MKEYYDLEEVSEIIMGQSPSSETYNNSGLGLPFFQGKSEFGEIFPTPVIWCSTPKKIAEPGDILISVRAPVGPTNLVKETCCIGRGLAAIRPNEEKIIRDFLWLQLQYLEDELIKKGQGSTFEAINTSDLKKLTVFVPSIEIQNQIASEILKHLAEIKTAKESVNLILNDLKLMPYKLLERVFNMNNG